MLTRLYIHNFRCFENFQMDLREYSSVLLLGKNGAGKSGIGAVLRMFQSIARGQNRVGVLVQPRDLAWNRTAVPIIVEIEGEYRGFSFSYRLGFEYPENFKELRVAEESLSINGEERLFRERGQVTIPSRFTVDWHLVALPILRPESPQDPARLLLDWMARMIVLEPLPVLIDGESSGESLLPERDGVNLGDWFAGLQGQWPHTYSQIADFLRDLLPDLKYIENRPVGPDAKILYCHFAAADGKPTPIPFAMLSSGEKCYFLGALTLAALEAYGPLVCYWDEIDNHLTMSEVGHFVMSLRRGAQKGSQLLVTSHNPEAIRKFSEDNTFYLSRASHKVPTRMRLASELEYDGTFVEALIRDDVEL